MRLTLSLANVQVQLMASGEAPRFALNQAEAQFSHFVTQRKFPGDNETPWARIAIRNGPAPNLGGVRLFRTRMCAVYQAGRLRICKYPDGHQVILRRRRNCLQVFLFGEDGVRLAEILSFLILSLLGEGLDHCGWHRLHALGFVIEGRGVIIPAPSGAGKSTMAYQLLNSENVKYLGEESVLFGLAAYSYGVVARAYPTAISLRPEVLEHLGPQSVALTRLARRQFGEKHLVEIPKKRIADFCEDFRFVVAPAWGIRFRLFARFVLGFGNVQMIEFMLRPENCFAVLRILLARGRLALRLTNSNYIELSPAATKLRNPVEVIGFARH